MWRASVRSLLGRRGVLSSHRAQHMTATGSAARPLRAAATGARSREFPDEPRVGVGVVVLRQGPDVLLVRRGKEPSKGLWCFPGGSLELGETLVQCAAREVLEETGVRLVVAGAAAGGDPNARASCEAFASRSLAMPMPFAAVDSIVRSGGGEAGGSGDSVQQAAAAPGAQQGSLRFHYVIVEVAALAADPFTQQPVAGDDVDDAAWVAVSALRGLGADLVPGCAALAEEAARRFDIPSPEALPSLAAQQQAGAGQQGGDAG